MKLKRILVFLVLIAPALIPNGHAMSLTAVGGLAAAGASITPATGYKVGYNSGYGGGVLIGFGMVPAIDMELGILYMPRGFLQTSDEASSASLRINTLQAPLVLRVSVLPAISIGVGGYYSYGLGSISSTTYLGGGNFASTDYGLIGSVAVKLELLPFTSLIVDGRYLSGLANVSQLSGTTAYLSDLQVLGGIRFGY